MPKLTKTQLAQYKESFELFDYDKSGAITTTDLINVFNKLGKMVIESQIRDVVNEIDECGTGIITFNEFCKFMQK